MLDRIISFSLKNRITIAVIAVMLVVAGCWVTSRMEVDVFPDLNAPTVVVMTEAPGMAAEEVEQTVTFPLETGLNGVSGMRRIRSKSSAGFSVVWVEFDWDTEVYRARQNVAERLGNIKLPAGADKPVMGPPTSVLGEVMFVGLTSKNMTPMELRTLADASIAPRLRALRGVAAVSVIGGGAKEYQILLDPARMNANGVSLADITSALENVNVNASGGSVYDYGNEYILRGVIATKDPRELGRVTVKSAGEGVPAIMLENVADIKEAPRSPATGTASISGENAVLMTVTKQPETGTLSLTKELDKALENIQKTLPAGVQLQSDLYRQQTFIDASIGNIQQSLIEGAVFVCIVLFIFLMNPRTTLISIVTIPLSMLMTILSLRALGLTINTMSIGGIAIAIGSLVDDAIVDVENVYKRLRLNAQLPADQRKPKIKVIFDASREVRMPILNSTLIIIVSFIPLFFLQGIEGRMLVPLGVAFIISLLASTLVALTLTPVLCSWLLPAQGMADKEPRIVRVMKRWYSTALNWVLDNAKKVMIGCAVAFAGALALMFSFGSNFLPPFNEGSFTINVSAYPGISLEESDKIGRRAEEILLTVPEIKHVARKTGRAELDEHALGINVSEIEAPFKLDKRSKEEVLNEIRTKMKGIQGANIEIGQPISHRIDAMLSGAKANVAIKVFGADQNRLHSIAKEIKQAIGATDGVAEVSVEQQVMRPQLRIEPRREILARYGITIPQFADMVKAVSGGLQVSEVYEGNRAYDIVVKMDPRYASSIDDIRRLPVELGDGAMVPLETLADIRVTDGPNEISRENLERMTLISVNVSGRDLGSTVEDIQKAVENKVKLPENYRIEYGGQFESAKSASTTLALTSIFSLVVILMLLYNQFRNLNQSLVVMLNLPLALIGGVVAIALSSATISIPAIIGFISLFGIATRNGMLLVDRYNELQKEGLSLMDAVRTGSADRLNPIIMTALTSALALIPLAAGGATPGNEIQSPMAKVILGGLITSTFLNGFVIPIVYIYIDKRRQRKGLKLQDAAVNLED